MRDIKQHSEDGQKKIVVSAQITEEVWRQFKKRVEDEYGGYQQSKILEFLIKKYLGIK